MFKIIKDGKLPERATKYSACVDLFASEDVVIGAGETKIVGLGVCIDEQVMKASLYSATGREHGAKMLEVELKRHCFQLMLGDELAEKGLIQPTMKVVDLDYEDEIKMFIHNPSMRKAFVALGNKENVGNYHMIENDNVFINKGDKIGQITLLEHKSYLFGIEND